MARQPDPLFLERKSYRRRRLFDAVRLVVFLAFVLFMIPLLWPAPAHDTSSGVSMSTALLYVFGAWSCLILLAAVLTMGKKFSDDAETEDNPEQDG